MNYKIGIIDSNQKDLIKLNHLLSKLKKEEFDVFSFNDPRQFKYNEKYHVLFLSIVMSHSDGFTIAKKYLKSFPKTIIIFVTNHKELVYQACNIHPFDFIRKEKLELEISYVFKEIICKLHSLYPHITLSYQGNTYHINIDDIIFCESFNHHIEIHCKDDTYRFYNSLKNIYSMINNQSFQMLGRSYLVNMNKVIKLENNTLYLYNNYTIPINKKNKSYISSLIQGEDFYD